jgi:multiple sugar transport system substrate-binding protein
MYEQHWWRSHRVNRRTLIRAAGRGAGLAVLGGALAACGGGSSTNNGASGSPSASAKSNPVDSVDLTGKKVQLTFWHAKSGAKGDKLNAIVNAFNSSQSVVTVTPQFQGNYTDLYKKLLTSIAGGQVPDLADAYPSQVSEYQSASSVVVLDDYIGSTKYGLTKTEQDDYIKPFWNENVYPEYGNKLLSFPFSKSFLVLYFNADRLKAVNVSKPPDQWTWDDFVAAGKAATGGSTKGWGIAIDASTFDAMVYSRGGKLISDDQKHWLLNQQPGVDTLTYYVNAVRDGWAYKTTESGADQVDFGAGRSALLLATSSNLANQTKEVNTNGKFDWSIAVIPHGSSAGPATVLYGGSVAVFKTTPERQLAAWQFVKYFTSPDVTADWSVSTGYTPVRQSAVASDKVQQEMKNTRQYGVLLNQILQYGRPETTVRGTQDTRTFIEDAMTRACTDPATNPKQVMDDVVQKGDKALAQA